ncbi:MAG: serine/threonine protein kinase, partial [Planctomycetes bacterium]|nr:serine/threonine protein kinase [Planctomycetota bacterium]
MAPDSTSGPETTATPSRRFQRYEVREEVSRGGMGIVYRAWDTVLQREIALKVLRRDADASPEGVQRFWREAKSIASLRHPGIVPLHDVGLEEGTCFLTMDFISGETLQTLAASGSLDLPAKLEILAKVADAIHFAHERGIIHRDLKPRNILVSKEGNPYVTDFGLARPVEADLRITQSGITMGTPPYMSPEQARGVWDEVGPRADIYSLGATLYEILCGRPPFDGRTGTEILLKVVEEDPAKDADRRYETAREMAEDLRRILAGKTIRAHPPYGRLRRAARRVRRVVIGNLALVLLALAAGAVGATVFVVAEINDRLERRRSTPPAIPFYRDDFDEPGLVAPRPEWTALEGRIALGQGASAGRLVLSPDPETGGCLVVNLSEKFLGQHGGLRLRFDLVLPEGEPRLPPEIGCFLFVLPEDPLRTGYRFRWGQGFGGRRTLLKNGRTVRSDAGEELLPGLTFFGNPRYSVRMDLYRDEVRIDVNGEPVFDHKDDYPEEVVRARGCVWGFFAFGTALEVDTVEVERQGVPQITGPLDFGDELYAAGNWAMAQEYFARVRESVPEGDETALYARYRMALCRLRLEPAAPAAGGADPPLEALRKFAEEAPPGAAREAARIEVARRWAGENPARALDFLRPVLESPRRPERANAAALFCLEQGVRRARAAIGAPADPRAEAEALRFLEAAARGEGGDPTLGARSALLRGDLYRRRGAPGLARQNWERGALPVPPRNRRPGSRRRRPRAPPAGPPRPPVPRGRRAPGAGRDPAAGRPPRRGAPGLRGDPLAPLGPPPRERPAGLGRGRARLDRDGARPGRPRSRQPGGPGPGGLAHPASETPAHGARARHAALGRDARGMGPRRGVLRPEGLPAPVPGRPARRGRPRRRARRETAPPRPGGARGGALRADRVAGLRRTRGRRRRLRAARGVPRRRRARQPLPGLLARAAARDPGRRRKGPGGLRGGGLRSPGRAGGPGAGAPQGAPVGGKRLRRQARRGLPAAAEPRPNLKRKG